MYPILNFCCTFLDDFETATRKLKRVEIISDLQRDLDENPDVRPRRRILKRKFSSDPKRRILKRKFCSDESDSDEQISLFRKEGKKSKQILPRPPPMKINTSSKERFKNVQ